MKGNIQKILQTKKQRRPDFQKYITTLENIIFQEEENFFSLKKKTLKVILNRKT
jgi:hypothetical protein